MIFAFQPDTVREVGGAIVAAVAAATAIGGAVLKALDMHHKLNVKPLITDVSANLKRNAEETAQNTKALDRSEAASLRAQEENRAAFARHDKWQADQDMQLQAHNIEIGYIKQHVGLLPRAQ